MGGGWVFCDSQLVGQLQVPVYMIEMMVGCIINAIVGCLNFYRAFHMPQTTS